MAPSPPVVFREAVRSRPMPLLLVALGVLLGLGAACASTPDGSPADLMGEALEECEDGVEAADAGRWEEAEFRWMKALAIHDGAGCGHNNLAVYYEREGRFEQAAEAYERALGAASGPARGHVEANAGRFRAARSEEETEPDAGAAEETGAVAGEATERPPTNGDAPRGARTLEVTVSVPEGAGRDLANYERVLVGNFVVTTPDAPLSVNASAVRYFRRRIVQRTFFQTVDLLTRELPSDGNPLDDAALWAERAALVEADLVFTGRIGLETENASRVVTERIRTPAGGVEEVARFREMTAYRVDLDYRLLRGSDGTLLLDGALEAGREFAADQGLSHEEAFVETLEELLPELLDAITPSRTEQNRLLIY